MNFVMFHPTRQTFSTNKTMKVGKVFFISLPTTSQARKNMLLTSITLFWINTKQKKKKKTYEIGKGKQKGQKGRLWLQIQLLCFSLA
jgi:hypothetical protein